MRLTSLKNILLLFLLIASTIESTAGKGSPAYKYQIDLSKTADDKLFVDLTVSSVKKDIIKFYMPKIIPGTYSIADYGRFVSEFAAYDKKGRELPVKRLDDNSWEIKSANKLRRITYSVEDTYDTTLEGPNIFQPAGSNIEAGENYVINPSGYFGYLEDRKNVGFEIKITHPSTLYGATGLKTSKVKKAKFGDVTDIYRVPSYDRLIDSPFMYSAPDTSIVNVGGTEVLVASYSPNKIVTAKEISNTIKEVLLAQREYLGGKLPVDKYAFIFYFTDQPVNAYGALEHSYSSFYYMPERPIEAMEQQMRDFAAHEFFHIVTPLTVHSKEIHQFDFNKPKMSQHLWMYEGMTEYFAGNVQVKYDIISPDEYLQKMRQKMIYASSAFNDTLAFTDLSKFALGKHEDQYGNVYQKGALIGMCLDIKLRQLSNGKYGVQNLMSELSSKYGTQRPFNDNELFDEITKMTYPEIGSFFAQYVSGTNKLPLSTVLELVGVNYQATESFSDFSLGFGQNNIGFDPEKGKLFFQDTGNMNSFGAGFGFQDGDIIKKIDGDELPPLGPELGVFFQQKRASLAEGNDFSYTMIRKDANGEELEVTLSNKVTKVSQERLHQVSFDERASKEQLALREAWLRP